MLHKYGTGGKREQDSAILASPGSINDRHQDTKGPIASEPALPVYEFPAEKRGLAHSATLNEVQDQQQNHGTDKSGE